MMTNTNMKPLDPWADTRKTLPLEGTLLAHVDEMVDDSEEPNATPGEPTLGTPVEKANVLTSVSARDPRMHKVVLDIDMPVVVVPSSTPGHHHLMIDKELDWGHYQGLLVALAEAGLISHGYRNHSVRDGFTAVRLPWIKKHKSAVPL